MLRVGPSTTAQAWSLVKPWSATQPFFLPTACVTEVGTELLLGAGLRLVPSELEQGFSSPRLQALTSSTMLFDVIVSLLRSTALFS